MILGLHGRMGSGKNEAAKRLATMAPDGYEVTEVSFAAPLKRSVAALFDVSLEQIEAWKNDGRCYVELGFDSGDTRPNARSLRGFLQRYGTEAHREIFGQDFWLDAALPLNKSYSGKLYVVTDVRFPNEIERVKALGGYTVKIVDGTEYGEATHASEVLSECDFTIDNSIRDDNFKSLDMGLAEVLARVYGSRWASEWLRTV